MLRALTLPDVPVIQAVTLTFVVIHVVMNLVVDISYGYLNPRVRVVVSDELLRLEAVPRRPRPPSPRSSRTPASRSTRRSWRRRRRARGGGRSGGCSATSRRSSRSRSSCSSSSLAVFAPLVAPHDPDAASAAVLGTELGPPVRHRQPRARHLQPDHLRRAGLAELRIPDRGPRAARSRCPIGLLAGFRGGGTDIILMRVMDALASFPPLVLALAVVGILGAGLENAVLAIAIVMIPGFARLDPRADARGARGDVHRGVAARWGRSPGRIRRKRVLPNVASPLIVAVSLAIGFALIAEAGLSLLGFGVLPPDASWGSMISRAHVHLPSTRGRCSSRASRSCSRSSRSTPSATACATRSASGCPKGKQKIKGRLGLTTVDRADGAARAARADRARADARGAARACRTCRCEFLTDAGPATVVDNVSFDVAPGEMLGSSASPVRARPSRRSRSCDSSPSPPGRIIARLGDVRRPGSAVAVVPRDARGPRRRDRDGLPGPDDEPQPGVHHRHAARRHDPAAPDDEQARRARTRASSCSTSSASPTPSAGSRTTRTSCRVGCASAPCSRWRCRASPAC